MSTAPVFISVIQLTVFQNKAHTIIIARMRSMILTPIQLLLVVAISTIFLAKSQTSSEALPPYSSAQAHEHDKTLNVITTRSFHNYQESSNRIDGLSYQLIKQFADAQQHNINIIIAEHSDEVYQALDNNLADIALLDSPIGLSRQASQAQSMAYMQTTTELIYRHGNGTPNTFEELSGKTIVVHDSEQLREKQAFIQEHYPDIHWQRSQLSSKELLKQVHQGKIDYTLIDTHEFVSLRAKYSRTRSAFPIYYPESLNFALSDQAAEQYLPALNQHLQSMKDDGSLQHEIERFYGHSYDSNPRGSHTFFARVSQRLPQYQPLIQSIAQEYQLDWRLLAAVAYQESHWNPLAKSPTGVRGMMMLTLQTAKELGVSNRLDTEQSLRGGAAYLKSLMLRLPQDIQQPDRTWLALASYNVGIGHVMDAQEITEFHGGNKNRWADVKKYLPLLEKPEWSKFTRYGQARGSEPVSYVQNIRHFTDLLEWRFPIEAGEVQVATRNFNDVINDAELRKVDPEYGPVRLSALMSDDLAQANQ